MADTLQALLDRAAARAPDKTAVVAGDRTLRYGEVAEESRRIAHWLRQLGVSRGDRVVVRLPNRPEVVTTIFAAARLGAIFVVLNDAVTPPQLEHVVGDAAPRVLLTDRRVELPGRLRASTAVVTVDDYWVAVREHEPREVRFPGLTIDPVCLIYTSGSTAQPKGVVCTHRNVRAAAAAIQARLDVRETDVLGDFLPLSFDYGLYQVFLAFQAGATVALGGASDVGPGFLRALAERQVTGLPVVPSVAASLLRLARRAEGRARPHLRFLTNTGERLAPETVDELRTLFPGCRVFVMYGLTECKRVSILDPDDFARKRGSVGTPLPDTECLVVDDEGRPLPAGQVGELVVRGPHVMSGYWNAPEPTGRRFRTWGPAFERVLFTGDRCSLDEDGFLYFHGRDDDVYKSRGYRVSGSEIEAATLGVPGIRAAALIPPDDGEGAVLFVAGNLASDEVIAALRERIEDYKIPDVVVVTDAMPINAHGKIDRGVLRARRPAPVARR